MVDYKTEGPLKRHAEYDVVFDTFGVSSFGSTKTSLTKFGRHICPVLGLTLLRDMILTGFLGGKKAKFAAAGMSKPEVHREELAEILSAY